MKRVVLGLSGGIDSAVSAWLLKRQGYDVHAVSFKFWDEENDFYRAKALYHQHKDALYIASQLNIEWEEIDATQLFSEIVIKAFADYYLQGKTPNPCINCNPLVKWRLLSEMAKIRDCGLIATGHYAGITQWNGKWFLRSGKDNIKDQSYMLWKLSEKQICRTIFPLADLLKQDVKKIAEEAGLSALVNKQESYNICFLPRQDYREWLKTNYPESATEGAIVNDSGNRIGTHSGICFYTVGEELKNLPQQKRLFVNHIFPDINVIEATEKERLYQYELKIVFPSMYLPEHFVEGSETMVRIRGKERPHQAVFESISNNMISLKLSDPIFAPSKGQSAVFYHQDCVVGGGEIG
ncbi:MAG: tRNA 2-thiouridine(34) synthase MnmA [Bacteroidales bacterium]|jgi:tRNA-specific 2-thiouridylase|nr:tRNA 2-thiouridine(34) synthase MnmA [Bacteroidales bacterium]